MVDGLGVGDVGNVVIKDRQNLASEGVMVISVCIDRETRGIISGPDITSRGFVYVRENESLLEDVRNVVIDTLNESQGKKTNLSTIKNSVREDLSDYLWRRLKRTPVIIPAVMEIDR